MVAIFVLIFCIVVNIVLIVKLHYWKRGNSKMINSYDRRKCPYIDRCPHAGGWCNNKEPEVGCITHILARYEMLKDLYSKAVANKDNPLFIAGRGSAKSIHPFGSDFKVQEIDIKDLYMKEKEEK
jgi:hypothetical protein